MLSRPYERDSDLRLMQSLAAESWRLLGPLAPVHVGDLAWWMYSHPNKLDEVRVRLWFEEDDCVAWGWLYKERDLDVLVHPDRADLLDEVLDWAAAPTVHAAEADAEKIARLEAAGYEPTDGPIFNHMVRSLEAEPPNPELPTGYRLRTVEPGDLERRVDVHRAAFAPSRVVRESYRRLQREWPYRADLDHVVEASDGNFAAFCIAWLDEKNRAGLLEPVGTHPHHQRRGLATAVCLAAVRSLRALGAATAVIGSRDPSDAERVYEKVGFQTVTRHVPYGKNQSSAVV